MSEKPPDRIYLQWVPESKRVYCENEITWCEDQINGDDVVYVRADSLTKGSNLNVSTKTGAGV